MSQLVDHEIERLAKCSPPLIHPYDPRSLQGASYDMRLGSRFAANGEQGRLTDEKPTIVLEPGGFAVLTTLEVLSLPLDVVGRVGLVGDVAVQGLISLITPQIDPGFAGFLIIPIFNGGDEPLPLVLSYRYFTIEFSRTNSQARQNWSKLHGSIENLDRSWMRTPRKSGGLISTLREHVTSLERDVSSIRAELSKEGIIRETTDMSIRTELETLSDRFQGRIDNLESQVRDVHRKRERTTQATILWATIAGVLIAMISAGLTAWTLRSQLPQSSASPAPATVTRPATQTQSFQSSAPHRP